MSFDCEETFRRMQDFLDRELSPEETRWVQEHLDGCGMCAEEYLFEASVLRRMGRSVREIEPPADLFQKVSARLDEALR